MKEAYKKALRPRILEIQDWALDGERFLGMKSRLTNGFSETSFGRQIQQEELFNNNSIK